MRGSATLDFGVDIHTRPPGLPGRPQKTTMNRKPLLWLALVLALTGCANAPAPPVLPKMEPLRINVSLDAAHFQVVVPTMPGKGSGIIEGVLQGAAARANQQGTEGLRAQMSKEQQGEALAALFRSELLRRFSAKGGVLAPEGGPRGNGPEVNLDHLSAVYQANSLATNYTPVAFVYLSASTDPSTIGNRAGAHIRSIDAKVSNARFAFATTESLLANPARANEGLRVAIADLAEQVATLLVAAQRGR